MNPSEFELISANLALSEVIALKVHIKGIKSKTHSL